MLVLGIRSIGLVTSLGFSAAATCAALRAGLSNPSQSTFIADDGEPVAVHRVPLERPWTGRARLTKMLTPAIAECLKGSAIVPRTLPMLMCVAERNRPGRIDGLDEQLFDDVQIELGAEFDARRSAILPMGRFGALAALQRARQLLSDPAVDSVIVAAVDSLITLPVLAAMDRSERLLTTRNSNGFIAGEGAGALLVGRAIGSSGELSCIGLGSGTESATLLGSEPLRADGLSGAIRAALAEAGLAIHDVDFRISDISGEQYFFKEATLAVGRLLRQRKESFDLWHPAEGIGEAGALAAVAMIAVAWAACRKGYAPGPRILLHAGSDGTQRFAALFEYGSVGQTRADPAGGLH